MRPRIGEAPPVETAITSGLRSTIEGMMKSESLRRSATLTSAPALLAAARPLDQAVVLGRDEAEAGRREILGSGLARRVAEIRRVREPEEFVAELGREHGDPRARAERQFGAPRRNDASSRPRPSGGRAC